MILIIVKFTVRPERSEDWLSLVNDFTQATRQEPGNVFFEWSRSVEDPNQFVLLEAFTSPAAGESHVHSEHFQTAISWMPHVVAKTPEIINTEVPGQGWSAMAEVTPPEE